MWTNDQLQLAQECATRWAGTPHRNRIAVMGQGIDCIHFVLEILIAAGIVTRTELPFYDERLGALRMVNVIESLLTAHLFGRSVPPSQPLDGDIVVCKCGRQTNHVGIILTGQMWHVPGKGRVGPEPWTDWVGRAQCLVRIERVGYRVAPGQLTWGHIRSLAGGQ